TVNGVPFHRVPVVTPTSSDGGFTISGLREGAEYRANFMGPIPPGSGLYLKSIRFNGDDVLSKPLKFSSSASGEFEIILGTGGLGQIAGNVTDAQSSAVPGALVVAVPIERGRIADYRTTSTDQNGRYTLGNLTPGDYQLFAWESIQDDAFYDRDFLKQYEQYGQAIRVAKSSSQDVDVRAISAP
ncbi:MAG TPA: carboxypeptidase-like regulatory domain-containing protein, partial [Terriglobia bacterium]|nr:carboxypeptidase-like regulatory domain-containing protein [Terriglobia bacterium]